jgi:dTDP-4-dehydrorhamnose 3,5-epimerase-like enzyme
MSFSFKEPTLIKGGLAVDDRGSLMFANEFHFEGVKRFYVIENHQPQFVRAWHGHKKEAKYFIPIKGSFIVGAVPVDNWDHPNKELLPFRITLSEHSPQILAIPPGYANGLMNLTPGAKLLVLSTSTLDESKGDDFRYPGRYWDIWKIEER